MPETSNISHSMRFSVAFDESGLTSTRLIDVGQSYKTKIEGKRNGNKTCLSGP